MKSIKLICPQNQEGKCSIFTEMVVTSSARLEYQAKISSLLLSLLCMYMQTISQKQQNSLFD